MGLVADAPRQQTRAESQMLDPARPRRAMSHFNPSIDVVSPLAHSPHLACAGPGLDAGRLIVPLSSAHVGGMTNRIDRSAGNKKGVLASPPSDARADAQSPIPPFAYSPIHATASTATDAFGTSCVALHARSLIVPTGSPYGRRELGWAVA